MMEDWTDIIGEELESIEEPLPADDWSVLQQKYSAAQKRKKAAAFAWAGGITSAAAAIVLVLLLIKPGTTVPGNDFIAETLSPADTVSHMVPSVQQQKESVPVAVVNKTADNTLIAEDCSEETFDIIRDTTTVKDKFLADASTPTVTFDFEDFPENEPHKKRRPISIGLSGATSDSPVTKVYGDAIPNPPMDTTDPPYTDGGLNKDSINSDSYNHEIPISLGISARINLTDRLSINTGLNYTMYKSTRIRRFTSTYERQTDKQYVHYLGIPVRLDFMAVNRKHFNFYLGAGMQMDKCIYATVGSERLYEKQVLFGVNGTMGLQVNIVPMVGLYIEPEVYYAFNEGSIETFRSDEPFVITVRGGLRFNF